MWIQMTEAEKEDLDTFIGQFEGETGHTVNTEEIGELGTQLETAVPSGEGPDLWPWAHDWVGRFGVREDPAFLYDASDDLSVDLSQFSEVARNAVQWNDKVHGLPFGSETVALFYNQDMVDEPPETLEEMISTMEEYHSPSDGQWGLSYPATNPYFASGFLQAYGGNLYDEANTEVTIDSDACVQGLETLQETLFNYIAQDPGYEPQKVTFVDGNAPFAINGPWELGNFRDALDNVGVAPLPTVDGNHPRSYTGIQMWYFSAELADADEGTRNAALDWAEWYTTTPEVTQTLADSQGVIPVHTENAEQADLDDAVVAFSNQVDHGTPQPSHPDMDSVWGPAGNALTRVFNGNQEPQEALEQAATEIRDAL
jgi:arabinogalactan oligomer/maltooligosaccharide transport system substrate-binding protein